MSFSRVNKLNILTILQYAGKAENGKKSVVPSPARQHPLAGKNLIYIRNWNCIQHCFQKEIAGNTILLDLCSQSN